MITFVPAIEQRSPIVNRKNIMKIEILENDIQWHVQDDEVQEMDESTIEHIKDSINKGYSSGEIVMSDPDTTGWWEIVNWRDIATGFYNANTPDKLKKAVERMICQTYTDMPPFYSIKKAYNRVPVETASHDISEIIRHLKRGIRIDKTTLREDFVKQNPKVKAIYLDVIAKKQMFLDKTIAISI